MTTFDERALASLPEVAGFTGDLRRQAFADFEALPIPSQETEEWRYTDLGPGPDVRAVHGGRSSGEPRRRAGGDPEGGGRHRGPRRSADPARFRRHGHAPRPDAGGEGRDLHRSRRSGGRVPDLVERSLHDLVPTKRTRFTAMHGAFRTGGTFLYVPRDTRVDLPLQTLTYVDVDGAAVFPHC